MFGTCQTFSTCSWDQHVKHLPVSLVSSETSESTAFQAFSADSYARSIETSTACQAFTAQSCGQRRQAFTVTPGSSQRLQHVKHLPLSLASTGRSHHIDKHLLLSSNNLATIINRRVLQLEAIDNHLPASLAAAAERAARLQLVNIH